MWEAAGRQYPYLDTLKIPRKYSKTPENAIFSRKTRKSDFFIEKAPFFFLSKKGGAFFFLAWRKKNKSLLKKRP